MSLLTILLITVVAFACTIADSRSGYAPRTETILSNGTTPADDIRITYDKDSNGSIFMHLVIRDDPKVLKQLLKILIQKGADKNNAKNDRNNYEDTPLHKAAENGYYAELAQLLIANGADFEAKKYIAQAPLLKASAYGPKEVVQQLIANGADINGTDDKKRWTPLKVATTFGQKEIVQLLIDYGADINFSDIEGNTALHQAAHYGHKEIAQILIDNGADINAKDRKGETPLKSATAYYQKELAQFLRDRGALM